MTTEQRRSLTSPDDTEMKLQLLEKVVAEGIDRLGLRELWSDCENVETVLQKLPIYHLVDYGGLTFILGKSAARPNFAAPS